MRRPGIGDSPTEEPLENDRTSEESNLKGRHPVFLKSIILSGAALAAIGLTAAVAQYPQPQGAITVSVDNPNPLPGQSTGFSVLVVDSTGAGVGGRECTAAVTSQPGSDASVAPASFVTGTDGSANLTLSQGSVAGEVAVTVTCGELSASTLFGTGRGLPPADDGTPPASGESPSAGSDVPKPPSTGQGFDAAGNDGMALPLLWVAIAGIGALGATAVAVRRHR